ncbi:MAG: hypothetical protein LW729_04170 [Bacteroidetes bacterium]|jgi:hypothetical protein|nr:hypothetical protein [Bacteroidota bacterium]
MASLSTKIQNQLNRLKALEQGFKDAGLRIRYEKGHFQSGYCLFEDQGVVIINKFYSPAAKIDTLEDITRQILGSWTFLGDPQRESLQRSLEVA